MPDSLLSPPPRAGVTGDPPPAPRPPRDPAFPPRPDPGFWGRGPARPSGPRARRSLERAPAGVERLLDTLRDGRVEVRVTVIGVALAALVAGFIWYRLGAGSSADLPAGPRSAAHAVAHAPTPTTAGPTVAVHVAGAVKTPGVVELAQGSRVIDALEAVGGGLAEADLDRLNLAARVVDGQRILVPRVGDPAAPADETGSPGNAAAGGSGLLDLNTATQAQLEALPGIGPVLAQAILDERARRGGFRSVNDLRSVRGIGDKRFEDLRERVTV